jgi:hypothetical protein
MTAAGASAPETESGVQVGSPAALLGRDLVPLSGNLAVCGQHGDELLTEVARTTSKNVARFKVRKPEPARRPSIASPHRAHS